MTVLSLRDDVSLIALLRRLKGAEHDTASTLRCVPSQQEG